MTKETRYPQFDVMAEKHEWDDHTQQIVGARLHTSGNYRFLSTVEAELLRAWCCLLVDDERPEIIQYVLDHIDQELSSGLESQRKPGDPSGDVLIRQGLEALDAACQSIHTERFFHLDKEQKLAMMDEVSHGRAVPFEIWRHVSQQSFFKKILKMTIDGYYSHPAIWSEIGYAGPAYPRGYVRMKPGQLDPWEPKEDQHGQKHAT